MENRDRFEQEDLKVRLFTTKGGGKRAVIVDSQNKIVKWSSYSSKQELLDSSFKVKRLKSTEVKLQSVKPIYQFDLPSRPSYKLRGGAPKGTHYKNAKYSRGSKTFYYYGHIYQQWDFVLENGQTLNISASSSPFPLKNGRPRSLEVLHETTKTRGLAPQNYKEAQVQCYYRCVNQIPGSIPIKSQELVEEALVYETSKRPRLSDQEY